MKVEDIMTSARLAGLVKRYHTWPTITTQSVAEHSWQVYRIYYEIFGLVPETTAYFIITHDMGELVAGDLPYPIKADNPALKSEMDYIELQAIARMGFAPTEIGSEEALRVKVCHMLEMMEFGLHESALGNRYGMVIADRCEIAARKMWLQFDDPDLSGRLYQRVARSRRTLA